MASKDGIQMFRKRHLFAEMHELRGDGWHETHRWNYGLQEDLREDPGSERGFGRAHLPAISVFGAMAFREALHPALVILDVEGGTESVFEPVARAIVEHLVSDGQMDGKHAGAALETLERHLATTKTVDHDELRRDKPKRRAHRKKSGSRTNSFSDLFAFSMDRSSTSQASDGSADEGHEAANATPARRDALMPDAEEEAVHVLIDDDFEWLRSDAACLVRLRTSVASGLEEHVASDDKFCNLRARFVVLVLGPRFGMGSSLSPPNSPQRGRGGGELHPLSDVAAIHDRHVEMGVAAAAMMQDDAIVAALYEASTPAHILDAMDKRLHKIKVLPATSRPTASSLAGRESRMLAELGDVKDRLVAAEEAALRQNDDEASSILGGYVMRLAYPRQQRRWATREEDVWQKGITLSGFVSFAQKYAVPLLLGITMALVLANASPSTYDRWAGYAHGGGGGDDDDAHGRRALSGDEAAAAHPTLFGLRIRRHDVTLHFLVNDVLMALFFGLAVKEIAEAFQPGGSLYPPTRKAVNPLCGTLGGVLGPIAAYLAILAVATAVPGLVGDDFPILARGWGIPTATDISVAWVTAYSVFGAGHPAINFLLLCAIIDDGIGLVIIAVAYREEDPAVQPAYGYLALVVLAMAVAYGLRLGRCAHWWVYVGLAGPLAWYGLLYAAVHPSLALCFVVPFLPLNLDEDADDGDDDESASSIASSNDGSHHRSPLHDFEHATKGFVDFGVLFAFGAVNAGVNLDGIGAFSGIVFLALLIGKTGGMVLGSCAATRLGFARPEGMSFRALVVDGVISSVGLTVSLFIAGEAYADEPKLQDQAKCGALASLLPALGLVAFCTFVPGGRAALGVQLVADGGGADGDAAKRGGLLKSQLTAIDEDASHHAPGPRAIDSDEEDLEAVIVRDMEASLHRIHRVERRCEERSGITRSETLKFIGSPSRPPTRVASDFDLSPIIGSPSRPPTRAASDGDLSPNLPRPRRI